jgi:hypothetical protein
MRGQFLSPEGFNHRGNAGAFVAHRFSLKFSHKSPKPKPSAAAANSGWLKFPRMDK